MGYHCNPSPLVLLAGLRYLKNQQCWTNSFNTYIVTTLCLSLSLWWFIHSTGMCRIRWFLALLRSFFHSSLLYTLSFHPFPPTSLPSSLTSSCHLFLGLPLRLVASKFIYNTSLGILFSSIFCTCPNQCKLFNLIVSDIVGFLTNAYILLLVNILQFSFSLSYTRPKILLYTFLQKMLICFISLVLPPPNDGARNRIWTVEDLSLLEPWHICRYISDSLCFEGGCCPHMLNAIFSMACHIQED